MVGYFRRNRDRYVLRLRPFEVDLLRMTVRDVQRFVTGETPPNAITERLYPDPSFDRTVSEELRDLIEDDLRAGKREAARALLESLPDDGKVSLSEDEAAAWLTALNDVGLAIGPALGVTDDDQRDEPDNPMWELYQWVGYLQETLVEALSGALPTG